VYRNLFNLFPVRRLVMNILILVSTQDGGKWLFATLFLVALVCAVSLVLAVVALFRFLRKEHQDNRESLKEDTELFIPTKPKERICFKCLYHRTGVWCPACGNKTDILNTEINKNPL